MNPISTKSDFVRHVRSNQILHSERVLTANGINWLNGFSANANSWAREGWRAIKIWVDTVRLLISLSRSDNYSVELNATSKSVCHINMSSTGSTSGGWKCIRFLRVVFLGILGIFRSIETRSPSIQIECVSYICCCVRAICISSRSRKWMSNVMPNASLTIDSAHAIHPLCMPRKFCGLANPKSICVLLRPFIQCE